MRVFVTSCKLADITCILTIIYAIFHILINMKVLPFQIPKRPGENIIAQIDASLQFYNQLHEHIEVQLSYILAGKGKLIIGNTITTYQPGEFIAIGSRVPHVFLSDSSEETSHMVSLFFTLDALGADFFKSAEMKALEPALEVLDSGFKLQDASHEMEPFFKNLDNEDKFHLVMSLLQVLRLAAQKRPTSLLPLAHPFKLSKHQGERLQLVFDYVAQNFQGTISLEEVAELVPMSKNAFCRFFKQRTQKTFFQFLAEIRIEHACTLLKEDLEMNINEIAMASGYHSISNFNKQFWTLRRMSPRAYRKTFSI